MEKQKLIEKWENKTSAPSCEISASSIRPSEYEMYTVGYGVARGEIIEDLKRLDKPQKVKVPKCVGELLDYYRNSTDVELWALLITFKDWYYRKDKAGEDENAIDWLVKHPEKYMRAWLDGYEVKESKWVVKRADSDYVTSFNQSLLNTNIDVTSSLDCVSYYKFTDLKKAEAVATLVDGSVEEV